MESKVNRTYVDWSLFSIKEDWGRETELNDIRVFVNSVTSNSLGCGLIPRRCPICWLPSYKLELHHWKGSLGESLLRGNYRRMCGGCNRSLDVLFRGSYPTWSRQYEDMVKYFKSLWPSFDSNEGWWSRVIWGEVEAYRLRRRSLSGEEKLLIKLGLLD